MFLYALQMKFDMFKLTKKGDSGTARRSLTEGVKFNVEHKIYDCDYCYDVGYDY